MSTRCPNTRPPCLRSGQGRGWKSHEPLDAALTAAAGAGEIGCLARIKSFLERTLRSPRGAFGRVRGGSGDEDWIPAEGAGMAPGSRRGAFFRGLGRGGGSLERRGWVAAARLTVGCAAAWVARRASAKDAHPRTASRGSRRGPASARFGPVPQGRARKSGFDPFPGRARGQEVQRYGEQAQHGWD